MGLRVLLVAPQVGLDFAEEEIASVVNTLDAKLLRRATIHSLLDAVTAHYDVLWFATHGYADGIQLTDGKLTTNELTAIVRNSGAQLVVLNTCESLPVALAIHNEVQVALVCTVGAVSDRAAYVLSRLFAYNLSQGLHPYEAWKIARLGRNETFVFLAGGPDMTADVHEPVNDQRLEDLIVEVERMVGLMCGNADWQYPGVLVEMQKIMKELRLHRWVLIVLAVAVASLAIILLSYIQGW